MQLRDYQLQLSAQGRDILLQHGLVYYSMEVRTGKSLTALHTASLLPAIKDVLFVTKKKAIQSICDDYDKLAPTYMIDVINFEVLHQVRKEYQVIIIDEAHTCGAFPSVPERVKQLKELCRGKYVIFLSGTPTPESYSQLFHQLSISDRGPWKDHKTFYAWAKAGYVTVKKRYVYNREFNDYSNANVEQIRQDTSHLFVSYSQEQAGFEQFVQEEVIRVKMSDATYKLAERIIKDKVYIGRSGEQVIADTAVKVMQKCHQIYSGTVKLEGGEAITFDDTKVKCIQQRFAGQKIAIFYKFIAEGMMLKLAFAGKWTDSPEEFNASDDLVFISQVVSGREGVNLSTADALVMFNIDFSAVSYWQVRARMQAKDRQKEAIVYWLFAEGGIEEKIYNVVYEKRDYTLSYFKKDFGIQGTIGHNKVAEEKRVVRIEDNTTISKRVS
ncbi:SNF2-related protein [Chitinophaga sp.]|uniref:SNF2-related protein n=1 Tax=Chitinophaga sp. TaxID=1869181 RepID=UPI0031DC3151